ncbi:MAG: hypothetical protein MUD14_25100 [Hydrococcus sp. Prado102]|jgi:hypothetical protein|nr:hypothetical protein [Hydrococcus sp. Prado102]
MKLFGIGWSKTGTTSLNWALRRLSDNRVHFSTETIQDCQTKLNLANYQSYFAATKERMSQLEKYHQISQVYTLPFSYLCQIYHLLNLKHLESIHSFSLGNLKVLGVNHFQTTDMGGAIEFQTALAPTINVLKMWRQPTVEVDLVLHSPFTVELSIPVYNGKRIIVLFNVLPISENEHKLFIDIYSDLEWHKPFLQFILHIATCLTLIEDLPYLKALAKKNPDSLASSNQNLGHTNTNMCLFKRFVELYGVNHEPKVVTA